PKILPTLLVLFHRVVPPLLVLANLIYWKITRFSFYTQPKILPHEAQLLNYLKATEMELGFLFNFGPKAQFIRRVFANDRKTIGRG
ncbi:MAG: hypothetical protein FJ215_09435, partial [Ignavibacteria bacterium]|nr:hypothetical protein [Ignavibacteria bacterium]